MSKNRIEKTDENSVTVVLAAPEIMETPQPTLEQIKAYIASLNEKQLAEVSKTTDSKLADIKVERKSKVEEFFKSFSPSLETFVKTLAKDILGDLDRKSINLSSGFTHLDVKGTLALTLERVTVKKDTSGIAIREASVLQKESEIEYPDKESLDKAA